MGLTAAIPVWQFQIILFKNYESLIIDLFTLKSELMTSGNQMLFELFEAASKHSILFFFQKNCKINGRKRKPQREMNMVRMKLKDKF